MFKTAIALVVLLSVAAPAIGQGTLEKSLDSLLTPFLKPNEPGGVVLVAKQGKILYKKAFGMAQMELNVPVNDSMIFYIGSNTKQFTAVAILQLLEKGKLQLQDSIGKFIKHCPPAVAAITLQQLLSHTSGLAGTDAPDTIKTTDRKENRLVQQVYRIVNSPIDFSRGTRWEYNNNGYILLGYIIELLTGQSYADYITTNIFNPAGMTNTFMAKELSIIPNRPAGYFYTRRGMQNILSANFGTTAYAAGGIQSSAQNMLTWNRALSAAKLLKPQTLQLAFTPQLLLNGQPTAYGLGWHLLQLQGSRIIRHGGLVPGFTSETLYFPAEDVYLVMLLNVEAPGIPIQALARIIGAMAINKPYIFNETAIDEKQLQKFIGLYRNEYNELLNISLQNGTLIFQRPNGGINRLYYAGNNEFFFNKDFLRVAFVANTLQHTTSLQISKVGIGMTEWLKTGKPLLKLSPEKVPDSLLKQYAGTYVSPGRDTVSISRDGVALYLQTGSLPKQMLAAENNSLFFSLKEELSIAFSTTQQDKALEILVTIAGRRENYRKL